MDKYNYRFSNTTDQPIPAVISFPTPNRLKQNLLKQRCAIKHLYTNNGYLPAFIPYQATIPFLETNFGCNNVTVYNNNYDVDSLKYFVVLRKIDNSVCYASFIKHQQQDVNIPPPFTIPNEESFVKNEYYWYPQFSRFIKLVKDAITKMISDAQINMDYCEIASNSTNSSIYLEEGLLQQYNLEFSTHLTAVLPFDFVPSQFCKISNVVWNWTPSSNDASVLVSSCQYWDKIIPYSNIILAIDDSKTDIPLEVEVYSSTNGTVYEKVLYELYPNMSVIDNKNYFVVDVNLEDNTNWRSFEGNDQVTNKNIYLNVYFQIQRGYNTYNIPYKLLPNEKITTKICFDQKKTA